MDEMDQRILPDAADVNGTAPSRIGEGSDTAQHHDATNDIGGADRGAIRPTFLSGLATAMREAAVRERERISSTVTAEAERHIEKVRSRAGIESEELRRLADEDVEHIEQWSESEIERIRREAARKTEERRSSLDEYLRQHDAIIETEIEGVNGAVRQYEATLDQFFAELSHISDPSEIVRRAGQLPQPPDLDEIRATARASAMSRFAEAEAAAATAEPSMTEPIAAAAPEPTVMTAPEPAVPAAPMSEAAVPLEATVEAAAPTTFETVSAAEALSEPIEAAPEADAAMSEATASADTGDGGAMTGVMDDGVGSLAASAPEPAEPQLPAPDEAPLPVAEAPLPVAEAPLPVAEAPLSVAETAPETPAEPTSEPQPAPVGVMDEDARRVPNWPAPAPEEPPAPISPTIDHTSAAVRLLRSVAPWTAPTHAGNRGSSDSD